MGASSSTDVRLLFGARLVRLFGYGALAVVLVLYLASMGLSEGRIGLLLTLTLLGDTAISLAITTVADRAGRRRMLMAGALLVTAGGVAFSATNSLPLLLVAAIVGVISPSGNEVGPFLAIEQAALSEVVGEQQRTRVFAWYALAGSVATAAGALAAGVAAEGLQRLGYSDLASYRAVTIGYAAMGLVLAALFARLSPTIEARPAVVSAGSLETAAGAATGGSATIEARPLLGLRRSRAVVLRLSALFALDSFAGGFVVQSIVAYWFHLRFGLQPAALGGIFFWANLLAGLSALAAAGIAARIGLVRTMVFTHLPSNVLLFLVPLMPTAGSAIAVLLARFSISQMDVPTRQSYTMAVVVPEERAAAAGVTGVTRTIGASLSPILATSCLAWPALMSLPFFVAGGLKIVYDLLLYRSFAALDSRDSHRSGAGESATD